MPGSVTAGKRKVATKKSPHQGVGMGPDPCITPAAPSPIPMPYPILCSTGQGVGDAPMRTKINGAAILVVGGVISRCNGNQPGTGGETCSFKIMGPCFPTVESPLETCERGPIARTGTMCQMNKQGVAAGAVAAGSAASASSAAGGGGPSAAAPGGPGGPNAPGASGASGSGGTSTSGGGGGSSGGGGAGAPPGGGDGGDGGNKGGSGGKPAKPPEERGMKPEHDEKFSKMAQENDEIILVRDSNPAAVQYMDGEPTPDQQAAGIKGFTSKPEEVKAKSRQEPPNQGLAALDPNAPDYADQKAYYESKGYRDTGPENGNVLVDENGNASYSDYDLHGTYDPKTGKSTWPQDKAAEQEKIDDYNDRLGSKQVNHGPHDEWDERNNPEVAGPNAGAKPPVTAYTPDGRRTALENEDDMKQFYKDNGMDWPYDS